MVCIAASAFIVLNWGSNQHVSIALVKRSLKRGMSPVECARALRVDSSPLALARDASDGLVQYASSGFGRFFGEQIQVWGMFDKANRLWAVRVEMVHWTDDTPIDLRIPYLPSY
jgi:hypothetical protein